jgi:hypothetical protein
MTLYAGALMALKFQSAAEMNILNSSVEKNVNTKCWPAFLNTFIEIFVTWDK